MKNHCFTKILEFNFFTFAAFKTEKKNVEYWKSNSKRKIQKFYFLHNHSILLSAESNDKRKSIFVQICVVADILC